MEVTTLDLRGMLGVVPPLFTQAGILYTYVLGSFIDWRMLSLSGVSLGILFIIAVWFIPESPLYLASKAKFEAAERSLAWLGRKNDSVKFFKEVQTVKIFLKNDAVSCVYVGVLFPKQWNRSKSIPTLQ